MLLAAPWQSDPDCGHQVVCEYQTHYCTYIRAPKLLSLQTPISGHQDELLFILAFQAYELWFRVLTNDLNKVIKGIVSPELETFEPIKLLNRSSKIMSLLNRQTELATILFLKDIRLELSLVPLGDGSHSFQLTRLAQQTSRLRAMLGSADQPPSPHLLAVQDFLLRYDAWIRRFEDLLSGCIAPEVTGAPRYPDYLALRELTALQTGVKGEWIAEGECPKTHTLTDPVSPDELLFIVVHQAFELWFRAILHEMDKIVHLLRLPAPDVASASQRMKRVVGIQHLLADQILIPATMLPMDFLKFRAQTDLIDQVRYERGLSPASGTESYQFREIEILGGLKGSVAYREFLRGTSHSHTRFLTPAIQARLHQPSLPELFDALLEHRGVGSLLRIFRPADSPNPNADLAELADLLLEFDQYFQLWRVNHLTMVQSMIGRKSGTGFLGPEYLKETTGMGMQAEDDRIYATPQVRPRFFERLWEARTRMQTNEIS